MSGQHHVEQIDRASIINAASAMEVALSRLPDDVLEQVNTALVFALDDGTSLFSAVTPLLLAPAKPHHGAQLPAEWNQDFLRVIEQARVLDSALHQLSADVGGRTRRALATALGERHSLSQLVSSSLDGTPITVEPTPPAAPLGENEAGFVFPPRPHRGCGGGGRFD